MLHILDFIWCKFTINYLKGKIKCYKICKCQNKCVPLRSQIGI